MPTTVTASPARITGLPLDQDCQFTVQMTSPESSAVSAPSPVVRMQKTRAFGYYNYSHGLTGASLGDGGFDFTANAGFDLAPVRDHVNVAFVTMSDPQVLTRIAEASAANVQVIIDISKTFYATATSPFPTADGGFYYYLDKTTLAADAEGQWTQLATDLQPYRSNVAAFYDEEAYWTASYQLPPAGQNETGIKAAIEKVNRNLEITTAMTHGSFPEIPYALVDEGLAFAGKAFIGGTLQDCAGCRSAIVVPATVDWVGFEGEYPRNHAEFEAWEGLSMRDYLAYTKDKATAGQRIVMAPPAYVSTSRRPEEYSTMAQVADEFYNLTLSEPRLVAVFPYFWSAPADTRVGLLAQTENSTLRDKFRVYGRCVLNGFSGDECRPRSIPAGLFRQPPSSIYLSDGANGYCGYVTEPHFLSYFPSTNASSLPAYPVIPVGMSYQGACPRRSCSFAGGTLGNTCVYDGAYAEHGQTAMAVSLAGGTGSLTALCSDGTWVDVQPSCAPAAPSILPGAFRSDPDLYYSNGAYHYCRYDSVQQYLNQGGNPNLNTLQNFVPIPPEMISDGPCG